MSCSPEHGSDVRNSDDNELGETCDDVVSHDSERTWKFPEDFDEDNVANWVKTNAQNSKSLVT